VHWIDALVEASGSTGMARPEILRKAGEPFQIQNCSLAPRYNAVLGNRSTEIVWLLKLYSNSSPSVNNPACFLGMGKLRISTALGLT